MQLLLPIVTTSLLVQSALADWQYRSRPDLAPPRLNITIPATAEVEKGYLFIAPYATLIDTPTEQHGPLQQGPYILRDNGDLVWSGYGFYSLSSNNFQAGRWKGSDVLFAYEGKLNLRHGHGHGHITLLDQHYETVRELRAGNHKLVDTHEFHIINEETGLIEIYQPAPRDLTAWGAKEDQQWIINAVIQELDIATGEVLFEWASLDHVAPDEAVLPINQAGSGYNSSDAWDYFHINSVDKSPAGDYLISARHASTVYKINGTSGAIIWRLGGKKSNFKFSSQEGEFSFQHHARWLPVPEDQGDDIEIISLHDNSARNDKHTSPTSSGKIFRLNTTSWVAELVQAYYAPDNLLSVSQGSTQVLPNGNVFVGWGASGAVTEFSPDGKPIFHAYLDSGDLGVGVQNYRGFRYNWTGLPNEEPAIVALAGESGTTIYASWNGDTETRLWRFFELGANGNADSKNFLGDVERTSFETSLFIPGKVVRNVSAEAVDAGGKVIRATGFALAEPEVLPAYNSKQSAAYEQVDESQKTLWRRTSRSGV